jgi:two-component system LytT family response regulator
VGLKALLVDDERLARAALRRMLKPHDDVVVVGEAANAKEAITQIRGVQPDVVFLDIEMPGANGLEMQERLTEVPPVIFTTAYPDYAVRAFDVCALDYLVKPIAPQRLASALEKLRGVMAQAESHRSATRRVFLRDGERCWILALDGIRLLESEGNYTRVHFDGNQALIYRSLNAFEAKLDPSIFFRISRSHIVNLRTIVSVQPQGDGSMVALLTEGSKVEISRRKARMLRERLRL